MRFRSVGPSWFGLFLIAGSGALGTAAAEQPRCGTPSPSALASVGRFMQLRFKMADAPIVSVMGIDRDCYARLSVANSNGQPTFRTDVYLTPDGTHFVSNKQDLSEDATAEAELEVLRNQSIAIGGVKPVMVGRVP